MSMYIFDYALLLPAGYVLLACICRVNMMEPGNSLWVWRALYIALAAWTGDVAADLASTGFVSLRDMMGVLAMATYMHLTRERWQHGVPEVARQF